MELEAIPIKQEITEKSIEVKENSEIIIAPEMKVKPRRINIEIETIQEDSQST